MRMSESQVRTRLETLQWDIQYWEVIIKQFENKEVESKVVPPSEHSISAWKKMIETLEEERLSLYRDYGELLI